jgi:hypothetical protein
MQNESVFILAHPGLGDHILCSGIYREYAARYGLCLVSALKSNFESVKDLVKDVENIRIVPYESEMWMVAHRNLLNRIGFKTLSLGLFGTDWLEDKNIRFDANYYLQAGLPLALRWDSFKYSRNLDNEERLFKLLGCNDSEYIFVHDDAGRNFSIKDEKLPRGLKIVRPSLELADKFSFFDYLKVIEHATQIHCIESSFCALIESLELQKPKFAHRYARPEAKNNMQLEFSYRSNWEIIL